MPYQDALPLSETSKAIMAALFTVRPFGLDIQALFRLVPAKDRAEALTDLLKRDRVRLTHLGRIVSEGMSGVEIEETVWSDTRQRLVLWARDRLAEAKRTGVFGACLENRHAIEAAIRAALDEGMAKDGLNLSVRLLSVLYDAKDWETTKRIAESMLPVAEKAKSAKYTAALKGSLGNAIYYEGRHREAALIYIEAVEIAKHIKDRKAECQWLGSLGAALRRLGEPEKAMAAAQQAIELAEALKLPKEKAMWLDLAANIAQSQGNPTAAGQYRARARTLPERRKRA